MASLVWGFFRNARTPLARWEFTKPLNFIHWDDPCSFIYLVPAQFSAAQQLTHPAIGDPDEVCRFLNTDKRNGWHAHCPNYTSIGKLNQ